MELAECGRMDEDERVIEMVRRYQELGLEVYLDDFGKGYAGMASLQRIHVDGIKIDRCFVAGLGSDAKSRSMIEAIQALGESMGAKLIAEGCETTEQLAELRSLRCPLAQGFLLSRPVDPERAGEILQSGGRLVLIPDTVVA